MGGNTMNQAFGSEGADKLLVRITTALATIFMILAISIQFAGKGEAPANLGLPSNLEGDGTLSEEVTNIDNEEKDFSKEEVINTEPSSTESETE